MADSKEAGAEAPPAGAAAQKKKKRKKENQFLIRNFKA